MHPATASKCLCACPLLPATDCQVAGMIDLRECACASRRLPSSYNHSCRKIVCHYGRHFRDATNKLAAHTLYAPYSSPGFFTLRASTPRNRPTALSYAPRHPPTSILSQAQRQDTHCVRLILIRRVHNPTLKLRCEHLYNIPAPSPSEVGAAGAGSHGRKGSMTECSRLCTEERVCLCTLTRHS